MNILKSDKIPAKSIIADDSCYMDYCDSYSIEKATNDTVDSLFNQSFTSPKWVDLLLQLRNSIVGVFGLKGGSAKDANMKEHYTVGSKAGMFTVVDRNENELIMAEHDKHLDFKISFLIEPKGTNTIIRVTTIVKFNNVWGRVYFTPVKPFHRLILMSMMRRMMKS